MIEDQISVGQVQIAKPYHRQLIIPEKQAYQGAKMFYFGVLPLSMVILVFYAAYLLQYSTQFIQSKFILIVAYILLTILTYVVAVYFYIKCNQIETFPSEMKLLAVGKKKNFSHKKNNKAIHFESSENDSLNYAQNFTEAIAELSSQQQITTNFQYSSKRAKQNEENHQENCNQENQDHISLKMSLFSDNKNGENNKPTKRYCHFCKKICEYRTKHCRKCQTCIERYDHHCFWIGNCVGRHNHRQFYIFLLVQSVNNYFEMKAILEVKQCLYSLQFSVNITVWILLYAMLLTSFGFLCFSGYLATYHTMLISLGLTTWEHMRRQNISYLKYLPKGLNPFSTGLVNNFKKFFMEQTRASTDQRFLFYESFDQQLPTFQEAKSIKPGFNLIDNQYYSCC